MENLELLPSGSPLNPEYALEIYLEWAEFTLDICYVNECIRQGQDIK